jgi:hypothetical protein
MANTIRLKRSSLAGKVPATTDLALGEIAVNTTDGKLYLKKSDGGEFIVEVGPVVSVAGRTGAVTLAKSDVGLGNADNTADAAKPISTATQAALDGKAAAVHGHAISDVTNLQASLDAKAPLASPALTGTPTAPTQVQGNNSTRLATTAYVDTLGSTKAASSHVHAIADVTNLQASLDAKAPLASPALTGTPTAPSAAAYADSTQIATTAQVFDTVTTVPENAQVGTAYTLVLGDAGRMVTLNNAAAITLTIPTAAAVAFPVGTRIDILQYGAGQVTVGGSVTIRSVGGKLKLSGQYSGATLWKRATNEWALIGDIA